MDFTIAGIPIGGDLSLCQRLELIDITGVFSIMMYSIVAIFFTTLFAICLSPIIHRGDCDCIPGMEVCDVCITHEENEQDKSRT